MRYAKNWKQGIVGTILLLVLVAFGIIVFDEMMSKQLDKIDFTWEEMTNG